MSTGAREAAAEVAACAIADRAAGEAYVASVCFKHGPPRLTGAELEFLVHDALAPRRPPDPARLRRALGGHAPATLVPGGRAAPLPAGSALTLEPGGQVEISTRPHSSVQALVTDAGADLAHVADLLAGEGLVLGERAIDPLRPPVRVLDTARYAAMQRRFAEFGPGGETMMCSTAAVQVCVDAGEPDAVPARWAAVHALGPVLLALFANSRTHAGRDTGYASARWRAVMGTEPARTDPAACGGAVDDPPARWASRVLDTPLMVRRRTTGAWDAPGRVTFADWIARRGAARHWAPPTFEDLDYHLTTLFTPVRPRGHLEVRYVDAQPAGRWVDPVALLTALLRSPVVVDRVLEVCAPTEGRWADAARLGLADPALHRGARAVAELGCDGLADLGLAPALVDEIATAVAARLDGRQRAA
ncbi:MULTISPECIES: glutamate-cysteine ligase family protein [Prauserella salsuginis group]|uniref:Glutamate--cysteine ligase EgtA n=1 Tax=Prauserella salsuginis TaxID=387889 RepID=A0ABW6G471_9PSEU|nr:MULTISPECIES: glutamate-cysteine ligase family protein [Prauserella salsuginis group]